MDIGAGLDRGEFLGFAEEGAGFDVDPPFVVGLMNAKDQGVVRGGAKAGVIVRDRAGHFVSVKDSGVVKPNAEMKGRAGGGAGMADACGGVHRPIKEVEAVFVSGAGGTYGHSFIILVIVTSNGRFGDRHDDGSSITK